MVPLTVRGAGLKHISQADFQNPAAADYITVANIPTVVAGYKIVEEAVKFGGGPLYLDMQDDT
jgi:hypothetical protein